MRDFTTTVAGNSMMPMVRRRIAKSSASADAVVTGAAGPLVALPPPFAGRAAVGAGAEAPE